MEESSIESGSKTSPTSPISPTSSQVLPQVSREEVSASSSQMYTLGIVTAALVVVIIGGAFLFTFISSPYRQAVAPSVTLEGFPKELIANEKGKVEAVAESLNEKYNVLNQNAVYVSVKSVAEVADGYRAAFTQGGWEIQAESPGTDRVYILAYDAKNKQSAQLNVVKTSEGSQVMLLINKAQ